MGVDTGVKLRYVIGNYVFSIIERDNLTRYPQHPFAAIYEQLTPKAKYSTRKIISNYVFKTFEEASQWVEKTYNNLAANLQAREDRKRKEREDSAAVNAADFYKVGDIVVNTWGWEQTNVDFYQVVKVGNKTIEVHPIAGQVVEGSYQAHGMTCDVVPAKDQFLTDREDRIYTLRVKAQGRLSNPASYYYMHKWDGRPMYKSWYA